MIVEFNIFYLLEEQYILQEDGKDIALKDCLLKRMAFVTIDNFTPRTDSPEFTVILSGGQEYICDEPYEMVKHKIQNANIFKFN